MNDLKQQVETLSREVFGIVPPIISELIRISPAVAYNYASGVHAFRHSGFSDIEQHAIQLRISLLNGCASCIKGHSFLLQRTGAVEADILAIREGLLTSDPSLNRLLAATDLLHRSGPGAFGDDFVEAFVATGITEQQAVEIIGLLSLKTIANYFSNFRLQTASTVRS